MLPFFLDICMGLFSKKKKTYVNTSVTRMLADEDYVPSNKMAVLEYMYSQESSSTRVNDDSITDYLLRTTQNNLPNRAKRARNYAKNPNYYFGIPKANLMLKDEVDVMEVMKDYLVSTLKHDVLVKYAIFGPMNNLHFLREELIRKYDYNQVTNELLAESRRLGKKCYLESAVIKYSKYTTAALIDPDTLIQHGYSTKSGKTDKRPENLTEPHVPWIDNYDGDHDIAVVTVSYMDGTVQKFYDITLDFLAYESSSKPPTDGLDNSDTNNIEPDAVAPPVAQTLDGKDFFQAFYEHEVNGVLKREYFTYLYGSGSIPSLDYLFTSQEEMGQYFPRVFARMNGRKMTDDEFKDTPQYKSMVGIGRNMGMNWKNWVEEVHKSVGSVGDVTQIFMTYAIPANSKDQLELKYLYEYFMALYGQLPDKFADTSYRDLQKRYVQYGCKEGQTVVIADKGYTQELSFSALGYADLEGKIGEVGIFTKDLVNETVNINRYGFVAKAQAKVHIYRKQVTSNIYREVKVYGLSTTEFVDGGHTTTASGDSENLLIQLDAAIDNELNVREREFLYTKSMYIVLHTVKVVKQKWYETFIFKAIMFVIAVVVSVFTGGQGFTLYAVLYAVVQTVVVGLIIQMAIKFLVVKLNINIGVAMAVVAVIAAIYGGYLQITKTVGKAGVTAAQMLSTATEAFAMSSQGFMLQTKEAIKQFTHTMAHLNEEAKEIQRKAVELGVNSGGPLLMFEPPVSMGIRMGEYADDYFQRSIHAGNVGTIVYSISDNFVDMTTSLPTLKDIMSNLQEEPEL